MDSLSFYYTKHELFGLNEEALGVVNFFEQPEIPQAYDCYFRYINKEKKSFPKYKIVRIAGTVLDRDNIKSTITLLTLYGVVSVKFNDGAYSNYNKQISKIVNGGKKEVVDASWFKRGTKLLICGYRNEDIFKPYRYKDTIYQHTVNRIESFQDGELVIKTERGE